jgi:hypothetical protein
MKTRMEMIYEFMVALSSNPAACDPTGNVEPFEYRTTAERVAQMAVQLTDEYLEHS